jgi:ribosomal protein L20
MRDSSGIKLRQVIVHVINSRESDGLTLSDFCIDLGTLENLNPISDYFTKHIQNSLTDPTTKAARFKTDNFKDGDIAQICHSLIHEGLDFIVGSQKIAQFLKEIIDKDKRIALGNLATCTYQADNYGDRKFIALIKLDPSDAFRPIVKSDNNGKKYISFELERGIMPTTKEKLQKCVFLQSLEPRHEDYDMMLLDRQTEEEPAQFFTQDFLKVDLALDDRERTKRFYRAMNAAINELRIIPELTTGQNNAIYSAFNNAIKQTKINIDRLIDDLPIDDKYKEIVKDKFKELPDREFPPDVEYVKAIRKKSRFKGDSGLYVSVNHDDRNEIVKEVKKPEGDSNYYIITLHTKTWKEEN